MIASERAGLPGWRWQKEYERDFGAQAGQPVFDSASLGRQQVSLREPLYRMDLDPTGKLVKSPRGRLLVYLEPDAQPQSNLPVGVVRVLRQCGIGLDVSEGVGESDSALEVFFSDNSEQAAELADKSASTSRPGVTGQASDCSMVLNGTAWRVGRPRSFCGAEKTWNRDSSGRRWDFE